MTPEDMYRAGRAVAQTLISIVHERNLADEADYARVSLIGAAMIASLSTEELQPQHASNEKLLAERKLCREALSLGAKRGRLSLDLFMHGFVPAEEDDARATVNLTLASMGGAGDDRRTAVIRALAAAYVLCADTDLSLVDLLPVAAETAGRADQLLAAPDRAYPKTTSPGGDA